MYWCGWKRAQFANAFRRHPAGSQVRDHSTGNARERSRYRPYSTESKSRRAYFFRFCARQRQNDFEVVDHQIENDIDVQTARA